MIAESINFVERKLESILREAGTKVLDSEKAPIFDKYLRLWQLVVCYLTLLRLRTSSRLCWIEFRTRVRGRVRIRRRNELRVEGSVGLGAKLEVIVIFGDLPES